MEGYGNEEQRRDATLIGPALRRAHGAKRRVVAAAGRLRRRAARSATSPWLVARRLGRCSSLRRLLATLSILSFVSVSSALLASGGHPAKLGRAPATRPRGLLR